MDGESIAKVKCKTCGSNHKYRDAAKPVRKTRASVKKEETEKSAQVLWETCIAEAKGKEQTYQIDGTYRVGDIVLMASANS
jgi:hypothetical protein